MKCIILEHRKWKMFFLFFLLLTQHLFAQETTAVVTGTVTNDKGDLLTGVTVNAANNSSKESYNTVTNERGMFSLSSLKVGSTYTFTASYVGYQAGIIRAFTVK